MPKEEIILNGKRYFVVTDQFVDMGRKKHTRMKIIDMKVEQGQCIISVEIRRGSNSWKKAYAFKAEFLEKDNFLETFKAKVREQAYKLEEDKHFQDRVLMRIDQVIDQEIFLD